MRPLVRTLLLRWFAVLGGPVAYAAVLVVGFWMVPVACRSSVVWPLHLLAAGCALLAGAATVTAGVLWWRHHGAAPAARAEREGGMAVIGLALGGLSMLLLVFHWIPVVVIDPCR